MIKYKIHQDIRDNSGWSNSVSLQKKQEIFSGWSLKGKPLNLCHKDLNFFPVFNNR